VRLFRRRPRTESTDAAVPSRLPARARRLAASCRQVLGIPDFERYLAHMRATHPGEPALSEREFHARAIDRRYGAGRPGCC
jgi:uncharacterized short protein YbdD (DUF466 family)